MTSRRENERDTEHGSEGRREASSRGLDELNIVGAVRRIEEAALEAEEEEEHTNLSIVISLLLLVLFGVVCYFLGSEGWASAQVGLGDPSKYCERARFGLIREPLNTWSNVGFAIVGLAILWQLGRERRIWAGVPRNNPMVGITPYSVLYGAVIIALGPASALYHGTGTYLGGWADSVSMMFLTTYMLFYNLARIGGWSKLRFSILFWGLNLGLAVFMYVIDLAEQVTYVISISWVVSEVMVSFPSLRPWSKRIIARRRWSFFWLGSFLALSAGSVREAAKSGGPLCNPDSLFQWHSLWHVVIAAALGCVYLYLRTERVLRAPQRSVRSQPSMYDLSRSERSYRRGERDE